MSPRVERGFTLLEVLLALVVFASISLTAYQVLQTVQRSDEQSQQVGETLQQLQRALVIMDSDFRQMAARRQRVEGQAPTEQLLMAGSDVLQSDAMGARFTRTGWINPQMRFPRGEVVAVGYRQREGKLERLRWRYPDQAASDEPAVATLLSDIDDLSFRFYVKQSWQDGFDTKHALPKAVQVRFTHPRYGQLVRTYLVAGQTLPAPLQREAQ
ncbi:type II secretion system protein GspJ [Salinivibrio kushneri]|uniref:type II secretion system minor pseudopilin GspJ n=1 Tax=Salinivibrio kushneri TaxID=1908198 RepID=UPI0009889857|nr:type II secretion system minor pseudopilin GspJ [Salinivibrio kushneri]OOE34531.1 type II secretion system protein GspJ [Salinivibrio kushneri]